MVIRVDKLLEWTEHQGMNLTELADKLGYNRAYIYAIKGGQRELNPSFIGQFAQTFGFDAAAEVFGGNHDDEEESNG